MLGMSADDDWLLRIAFHVDGYDHLRLAVVGFAAVVVLRIFDGIDDDREGMRQLVIQLFQEGAANQFGYGVFRPFLGDLLLRVHLRTFGHVLDQHVLDFGEIVMFESAYRHDVGEIGEFVDFNELVDQLAAVQLVDFGDDGNQRHLPFESAVVAFHREIGAQTAEDAAVAGADFLIGGQQERDGVHVGQRLLHNIIESLAEQRARTVDARGVHQNQLGVVRGQNAANGLSSGFRTR